MLSAFYLVYSVYSSVVFLTTPPGYVSSLELTAPSPLSTFSASLAILLSPSGNFGITLREYDYCQPPYSSASVTTPATLYSQFEVHISAYA